MAVYQEKNKSKWTKDGRNWYFRVYYTDLSGIRKQKESAKFFTKREALEEERKFLTSLHDNRINQSNMTFKDLYTAFYEYQKDKVRASTMKTYKDRIKYLDILSNIKLKDFSIQHFEMWKKKTNELPITNSYKNDILKFIKAIMNYGSKFYDFNFNKIYSNMTNFTDPNELPKEMLFFTFEEYSQFISVEDDTLFKGLFDTLYYMGLRKGELRGLQWKDINWEECTMSITKQIPSVYSISNYKLAPLKTKKSNRILPLNKVVYNDLKMMYEENKKYVNFNQEWFIFGNIIPISKETLRIRKNRNCDLANIKQIRIHDFRHSCASLLINNGASITLVAKYLGHAKIEETLNTYSHMFKNKLEDIVNLINHLSNP